MDRVGRRNAVVPALPAHRPLALEGFEAGDGLLGGALATEVGEDAVQAVAIVVHARVGVLEGFGAEPVREDGHAAGPVAAWLCRCDLWQAGASVVA